KIDRLVVHRHQLVFAIHATAPDTRHVHAARKTSFVAITSVCQRLRTGALIVFGVPVALIGCGDVSMCSTASFDAVISGSAEKPLTSAAGSSAIRTPSATPSVGSTNTSLGNVEPRLSLMA